MSQRMRSRLADLESERNFLLDSITDLDREHLAGDLEDVDYQQLRSDYVRRAAETLRAIGELGASTVEGEARNGSPVSRWNQLRRLLGRRRVRLGLGIGAAICLLSAAGLLAAHLAGVRLPGQSPTGSITMTQAGVVAEDLHNAALEANSGSPQSAILLYDAVLEKVPDQQVALTYGGWLTRLSGLSAHDAKAVREGDAEIKRAVHAHPDYADGEGLYGVVLYADLHSQRAAIVAFERCLSNSPSSSLLEGISPFAREVFKAALLPIPAAYAKG